MDHDRQRAVAAARAAKATATAAIRTVTDTAPPASVSAAANRTALLRSIVQFETYAMMALIMVCVAVFFFHERPVYYFAVNKKEETKPLLPMMEPTPTDQALTSWIGSAAADILNFGFHNVERHLGRTRIYFTEAGWKSFTKAIENTKLIERIKEKQQVVTAAPIGAPVIVARDNEGLRGPEWTLQIPFTVTVLSGQLTQTQKRVLTVIIVRVSPKQNLSGLGIDSWVETL